MGYTFGNFELRNIDATGNDLLPATNLTILPFPPTIVRNTAIGNRIIISFEISAFGGDNFTNKSIRVNFGSWTGSDLPLAQSFGFESTGFVGAVLTEGFYVPNPSTPNPLLYKNLTARFQKISNVKSYVQIEFYMTDDLLKYIGVGTGGNNYDRFLKAVWTGLELQNGGDTVYYIQREMGIKGLVFNSLTSFAQPIYNPADSQPRVKIPFESKWYNSYLLGSTATIRYIENIEITSASQIASGVPYLTKATATGPQTPTGNVDASMNVTYQKLSVGEKNDVVIRMKGLVTPGISPNPATTDIRIMLIRVNPLTNTTDFVTDLLLNDAVIPALAAGAAQLDGAIWTPSQWTDTAPDITDLQFVIDGSFLILGNSYRIVINTYDNVNSRVTTHISPELAANFAPPVTPTIDAELGTYNQYYPGNQLSNVAPHSRIKSRITIDKANYNAQLFALGITGTFDDSFQSASCELLSVNFEPVQTGNFYKNTLTPPLNNSIVDGGMVIVSATATELILDCYFRVDEEKAGFSAGANWVIRFNQPTFQANVFEQVNIVVQQLISYGEFENDKVSPKLLSVKVYDFDEYPTNKIEVNDICDRDYIIVEVEKDPLFTGSINFVATIYPADELGNTTIQVIEEEEQWLPAVQVLPQLSSAKLDDVDVAFTGDFAAFRVNVQQLTLNQRYWITAIAYEQFPTYCPLGFVDDILITTNRPGITPFWVADANPTNFINSILAHPDFIGGLNVVKNNLVDAAGNEVGTGGNQFAGYQVKALSIDQSLPSIYYVMQIDAQFDSGSGVHNISHTLTVEIPIPALNGGPVSYDTNTYQCNDLG